MGNLDIFHVSFESKIKAPTVRRWELRGITARRGEVDGATPFAHGEAHRLDARPAGPLYAPTTRGGSPPPAFGHLLAAADRGVQVRLLFRADNLAGGLVQSLQSRGVDLGTLTDLHAKFLITDTTAMNGSANFTEASADRASEVATFFSPHTRPSCTICASCSTTTGSGRDPTDTAPANLRSLSENPIWVAAGRCPGWTALRSLAGSD